MPTPKTPEASSPGGLKKALSIAERQEASKKAAKVSRLAQRAQASPGQKEAELQAARERLDIVRASFAEKGVLATDRATRESRASAAFEALREEFKDEEATAVARWTRHSAQGAGLATSSAESQAVARASRASRSSMQRVSKAQLTREARRRDVGNYLNSALGSNSAAALTQGTTAATKRLPMRHRTGSAPASEERMGPLWFLPGKLAPWRKRPPTPNGNATPPSDSPAHGSRLSHEPIGTSI